MSEGHGLNQGPQNIEMWQTMFYNSPQPTLIGAANDDIYEANQAARELLKIDSENIKNQSLTSLISRLDKSVQSMLRISRTSITINQKPFLIFFLQDIHEQKFSERLLLFFATTLKSLDFPSNFSLNFSAMISETARLAVKNMADWCRIDILHESDLKLEALAYSNSFQKNLEEFEKLDFNDASDLFYPSEVLRSGTPVFESNLSTTTTNNLPLTSETFALFQKMKLSSYICVPIKTADNILGCISLGRSCDKPSFDAIDVIIAEEFASKVGVNVERTQLYKSLEDMKKKADAANQAKTNFLANVSHEIRTPLGAIIGFSELLTSTHRDGKDYFNYKEKIKSNSGYLLRIIDDILDLSKVEAGKLNIEITSLDLSLLLRNVYETTKDRTNGKPVRIEFSLKEPMPRYIFSDETRLTQILSNIVGNSIKFTHEGFVRLSVGWLKEPRELLLFEVSDTGVGISDTQLSNLFKPFSQADASYTRKYGGTGLGLALSRNLARELGGDLTLHHSDLGQGATFWITIDPGKVNKQQVFSELILNDPSPASEENVKNDSSLLNNKQILLVEDSSDIQILIKRFLEAAGANITLASNGEEGIQVAQTKSFDLILMDIQMPVKDGCEATLELRRNGYNGLIIALTAHAMKEEHECCVKAGYDAHLCKPIRRRDLIANILKIERAFKNKQLNNEQKL